MVMVKLVLFQASTAHLIHCKSSKNYQKNDQLLIAKGKESVVSKFTLNSGKYSRL